MIAVIIPTLNEEPYIEELLNQLLQDFDPQLGRVIVVDGGSSDQTRPIVSRIARSDARVLLLHNPLKLQAAGFNLAARGVAPDVDVLIRIDAHAGYPPGYVARLADLLRSTGGHSVVVRLRSVGVSCVQKAIAAVSNSRWGTGGAVHRTGGKAGWVDHGHHAAFSKATFLKLGGYDESFAANEDGEFDLRLARADGRIWFAPELEVLYYPRRSLHGLARQYFRYGAGRVRTILKTKSRPRLRQCVTPTLTASIVLSLLAAPFCPWTLLVPAGYFVASALVGAGLAVKARDRCIALSGAALVVMHLAWGTGFIVGLLRGRSLTGASEATVEVSALT